MAVGRPELQQQAQAIGFSGAVSVQRHGVAVIEFASGSADRANDRSNNIDTRFAIASGTKAFTALTIMSLVESGVFALDTTLQVTSMNTSSAHSPLTPSRRLGTTSRC